MTLQIYFKKICCDCEKLPIIRSLRISISQAKDESMDHSITYELNDIF